MFCADRLQLPMEALCASLSLFSTKIKKTHLSLWVDYIIFQAQSGPACIQINPGKQEFFFQATWYLKWNIKEYCTSKPIRKSPGKQSYFKCTWTFLLSYWMLSSCRHCHAYCLFLSYSRCRRPRFAMSVLNSLLLLETLKIVTRNGKTLVILHSLVLLSLQKFPVITAVCVTWSHVAHVRAASLLVYRFAVVTTDLGDKGKLFIPEPILSSLMSF